MLNSDTKRHIDAARDVLVGVAPNPTTQIDQITYALIYKFMDDMDQASVKAGGKASFFVGDLEKYSWSNLMSTRMGNQEKTDLYSEALTKFSEAKQLPELFRTIFRAAFLPYRSPETLGLFLKEISYFDYTHPEELGNAYEYLLSIMSSQGDAGQFRTPRHIIDFIVDVINPTKDDKVLDPACGTGGFLVSTYNHILEQHDGKEDPKKKEKPLTPDERKKLMSNLQGYDIDPTMVRIAQVNMYLHQFKNPQIFQYDSLTSEERWNDKYDVILANPPFMSPKGGIKPHNKFGVASNRAEVLFVDYIINHLKPRGRAGIVVPEGIIFQTGNAYKALRRNLVESGLYAVVSLPAGVFQPYSGVKTSILFFDNELSKGKTDIAFVKISADGFDLGATKRAVSQNDLPIALSLLKSWSSGNSVENSIISFVNRTEISENGDYNLSGDRYKVGVDHSNNKWPMVKLGEICKSLTPPKKIPSSLIKNFGKYQVIDQSQQLVAGWTDDEEALVNPGRGLLIFGDHTCATKYVTQQFAQGADGIKILQFDETVLPKYVFHVLQVRPVESDGYKRHFTKFKETEIPIPPLEVQKQIVTVLDGYDAICAGAQQIVENWKPQLDVEQDWQKVNLESICEFFDDGDWIETKDQSPDGIRLIQTGNIGVGFYKDKDSKSRFISEKTFKLLGCKEIFEGDLLISRLPEPVGRATLLPKLSKKSITSVDCTIVRPKQGVCLPEYLLAVTMTHDYQNEIAQYLTGSSRTRISRSNLGKVLIPLPDLVIQKEIVQRISQEKFQVEASASLIETYQAKIASTINKLWATEGGEI